MTPFQRSEGTALPRALYVHVPFCLHHCGYCDFTLVANRDHLIPAFLSALKAELSHLLDKTATPIELDTLFIGGGTPTHLSPAELEVLFDAVQTHFSLIAGGEFSVEANPDGLCVERLSLLKSRGINRLSLGVQSFDNSVLQTLERRHTAEEARTAVQRAREYIPAISLDLIFGVPGQTLHSWQASLETAVALPISHISTYGLTYEQGTPFYRQERAGKLRRAADDLELTMYQEAIAFLTAHGFEHYEVSNFAKPGFQCRHNQVYWNADEYFAFGPGAARYLDGVRSTNCRSVVRWLNSWEKGVPCLEDTEKLSPEEKAREAVMLGLRMREGLDVPKFETRFGCSWQQLCGEAEERHRRSGMLERHGNFLRLTHQGLMIADSIVVDFL